MMDFTFEQSPWELFAEKLKWGDRVSAARFLTLLEGESEDAVEEAFQTLEDLHTTLDIADLPKPEPSGEAGKRLALEARLVREGKLLEGFGSDDPLGMYLAELASMPVCGDPVLLALELTESGNPQMLQERLVNLSLSRVVQLAGEYTGCGVLLMDLIQEGSMGLWQGILRYEAGQDFEIERDWWIRQSMARAVTLQARENGVGSKMRQALEDYRTADKRLLTELGRNPTLEEIALELHMTPEGAYVIQDMLRSARTVQQAKAAQEPQEETEDDSRHVEDTAYFQMRQRITELLSALSEQEARVLTLRYGLEGGTPMDPAQTGAKLGMTPAEVINMEAEALSKLRS
ncbi:MAG: sigma-70 family RNA polymerase sigma factor [Oscillospiraceae bacterium]|nr:sigma-70 family RNA polymerase sigma factor [Oscillospiraceae bacterium]